MLCDGLRPSTAGQQTCAVFQLPDASSSVTTKSGVMNVTSKAWFQKMSPCPLDPRTCDFPDVPKWFWPIMMKMVLALEPHPGQGFTLLLTYLPTPRNSLSLSPVGTSLSIGGIKATLYLLCLYAKHSRPQHQHQRCDVIVSLAV